MSNLEMANMEKVAKKLAAQLADAQYQLAQMTVIAEMFKEQFNIANNNLKSLKEAHAQREDNSTAVDGESTTT